MSGLNDEGAREEVIPPVPAIAVKAADLEALRKSVEDSAAVSGGLWLSYLFVLFYLGIAAGAVTHADVFLQNPVKLPFLNIELPLLAFFFLAPLLFLITHAYALVNLALLADRVRVFHKELGDQFAADPALQPRAPEIRSALTRQLPSNIFVQFLGGPDEIRQGAFGQSLAFILWATLVVAPIALLLLLQIQFLPYHNRWISWTTRIALVLDLGLIWWLWRNILHSRRPKAAPRWRSWVTRSIAVIFSISITLFACVIATIPGEWQEDHLLYQAVSNSLRGWLFAGKVDETTRHRTSLFSNTLVLPGFDIYEALKIDDPKKVEWKEHLMGLRGRDLKSAVLDRAVLTRADFTSARLQRASFLDARLQGASFTQAWLQGAVLDRAQLQGAVLDGAQLQGASLGRARLQGASLGSAQLQGASLSLAQLPGASFLDAQLPGADFTAAQLSGAGLDRAQLQGAVLGSAWLQGASLGSAQLQGAVLGSARLQGVWLEGTYLWRAQLKDSVLENVFAPAGKIYWRPIDLASLSSPKPWSDASYAALRQSIEREIPKGWVLSDALKRVSVLDCGAKDDTLASCDPAAAPPAAVQQWKKMIEKASVDDRAYAKALASILGDLVCSDEPDLIYVLRGLLRSGRFDDTRSEMPALAARITSSECPVSKALTDADKRAIAALEKRA
jgi:uncharacterized protein YjbI with pentapeptide repeats